MKTALLAVTAFAIASLVIINYHARNTETENIDELWASWKVQYDRAYESSGDEMVKKAIFVENYNKIRAHNSNPENTFTMALNQFGDLTAEEFKEEVRCMEKSSNAFGDEYCPSARNCQPFEGGPSSVDWRDKGAVTPVKNQGQCGSCWAFSTTGSLEGLYYLNNDNLLSFSEQELVDCSSSCYGCNGCFPYIAMEYTASHGIVLESEYPYNAAQGDCNMPSDQPHKVNSGYRCVAQSSVEDMQGAVAGQPVSIAIEADQSTFQFYNSGIITSGCGDSLDHAVLIVGYDMDEKYWIVKNSWGSSWGEDGYVRISTNEDANGGYGVCGILRCGTVPV